MTQNVSSAARGATSSARGATNRPGTGAMFAGVLLAIAGLLDVLQGIGAIAKDDVYTQVGKYVFKFNLTSWGWIHLVLGVLVLAVAFGVLTGASWARLTGVVLASLSLIENFLWLPYQPWWALTLIGLDVFIIWALASEHANATL